jgi:ABC-type polysaccharide/polyol phosphate transport system ATPase subunit
VSSPITSDTVIDIKNVSVRFELPTERINTLKERALRMLRGKHGSHKQYWALRDVNLAIKRGESIGLIGRNGAGKSTLLKVIARVYAPTTGRLVIRGRVAPLIELGTGFHPELTGRENIYLNGAMLGLSREEMDAKIDQIIDFAELGPFIDTPVRAYSSGMIVRLGFSIATDVDPDILIIDEVLSVGDMGFQKKSRQRMESFNDSGTTILFVSHSKRDMRALCDTGVWIDRGQIRRYGPIDDIMEAYEASFTDRPRLWSGAKLPEAQSKETVASPFADLPDALHPNLRWVVMWVDHTYRQGITFACKTDPLTYCPTKPITQGEVITALMRARHLRDALPQERHPRPFTLEEQTASIARATELGITPGGPNGQTQPINSPYEVTRAEIAVLLLKALHGADYTPPPAKGVFKDLDTELTADYHWMIPWIEQLYHQQISSGCHSGFCPNDVVDRATFAVMLGRAFQDVFGKPNT